MCKVLRTGSGTSGSSRTFRPAKVTISSTLPQWRGFESFQLKKPRLELMKVLEDSFLLPRWSPHPVGGTSSSSHPTLWSLRTQFLSSILLCTSWPRSSQTEHGWWRTEFWSLHPLSLWATVGITWSWHPYLLSTCYVPDTELCSGHIAGNKTDKIINKISKNRCDNYQGEKNNSEMGQRKYVGDRQMYFLNFN